MSDPFADLIPPPSFKNVVGGGPSDPVFNREDPFSDLMPLKAGIRFGEIPLPNDGAPVAEKRLSLADMTKGGWGASLDELADSPVAKAVSDNPLLKGFAGRVNEAAAATNLMTAMPVAVGIDALLGGNTAKDYAGRMVQSRRDAAAELAPAQDADLVNKSASALGSLAFDLPIAAISKPAEAIGALPKFLAATDLASAKQFLTDAFKEAAMSARIPATTAGITTALSVIENGGTPDQAINAGLSESAGTWFNFVLPMNLPGGAISRGAQGAGINVAGDAAQNSLVNQFLPADMQRDIYDPEQAVISAVIGAPMGVVLGDRGGNQTAGQRHASNLTNELDRQAPKTPEEHAVQTGSDIVNKIFAETGATQAPEGVPEMIRPGAPPRSFVPDQTQLTPEFDPQSLLKDLDNEPGPSSTEVPSSTPAHEAPVVAAMNAVAALQSLNPQLRNKLRVETLSTEDMDNRPANTSSGRGSVAGRIGAVINLLEKGSTFVQVKEEVRHLIDTLLGGGQVSKWITEDAGMQRRVRDFLNGRHAAGDLAPHTRYDDGEEIAQSLLDQYFRNPDAVRDALPDMATFLEEMGADKYRPVMDALAEAEKNHASSADLESDPAPTGSKPVAEPNQGTKQPIAGEPELINNGKRVFYPGDTAAMRAKLEAAGLNPGMRKVGENGEDLGLYFPATMRADVDAVLRSEPVRAREPAAPTEQATPDAPVASPVVEQSTPAPYEGAKLPPERSQRSPDTSPRPAQTGLFAEPTANERNTAESDKRDAERNGLGRDLVQPSQGAGDLFAGPRPKQETIAPAIKKSQRPDSSGIEVDEATDLTPEEMAAFQRQTEPKKPERTRPDTPIIADDSVTTGLTGIARNDDAFKHPTSKKMDVADIFRDIEPDYTLSKSVEMAEANETPADTAWRITTPEGDKAALYQKGNEIWVDVSDLKQGQGGSRIYNAVANYAHNNGKVFIGDPAGLSEIAQKRRAEQMLSSALKFGTTDHMQPHPKQLQGNQELGIPKLNWKVGDTAHNIRELAKVTSEVTTKEFGEIADLTYNPETLRFEQPDGREVTDADFKALAAQKRAGRDSSQSGSGKDGVVQPAPTAGVTTLKRAIIARQLASPDGGKLAGVLAGVSGRGAEHPAGKSLPNLGRVLYSRRDQTETPEFKKWFGDSKTVDADGAPTLLYRGEGKNVQREIMDSSKSRDKAVFLTPDKKIASIYSDGKEPFSYYVKADKLLDLTQDSREARDFINEWAKEYDDWTDRQSGEPIDPVDAVQSGMLFDYEGDWSSERWNSLQEAALQDHDAAYLPDYDSSSGVFKSLITKGGANIKSATGNNGDFDTTNPSILKSESAKPATEKPAAKESPEQAAAKNAAAEKTVAKTLGRSEIKRLKDKGNLKFLTTAQVMELGINGAKSQSDLRGVDGFYDAKSGNVYILSDSGANPDSLAGVVVHELVHSNMEAFLGTDGFQKLIKAFVRESATDTEAKAAMTHARTVDGDKSEAVQQEEGLAYFAQQNPDHPMTKRLVDEGKLFLNRLGVPLTWLNANNAALRKIIALNLKDAQYRDRSHFIGKGGVKYQRVFHGTPHRGIEKEGFKLQKIGTGEGAQAYGYGMYFAGNKDIAEHYREALAGLEWKSPEAAAKYDRDTLSIIKKELRNRSLDEIKSLNKQYKGTDTIMGDIYRAIESDDLHEGQLYHAEIPEDSDLLDYDKPLSEQPEKVKAALEAYAEKTGDYSFTEEEMQDGATGQDLYRYMQETLGSPKKVSEYLSEAGIPGLRYLDGTSRNKGEGSANYVIWDENLLTPEKAQITPYYSKRVDDTPQTETENFKRWFGGSKVVDAAGKPLMVYHGTPDASFAGSGGAGVFRTARESIGLPHSTRTFFFSSDSRVAQTYATGPGAGASPGVVQAYLSLKNPMVFNAKGADWSSTKNQIEMAQAAGADGAIIKNVRDDYTVTDDNKKQMTTTVYVAFRPEQIKSATGNNGQFDPSNPSILFSKRVDDTTREKNFSEAFKDTKVVDENGKPLVVYHGAKRLDRINDRFRAKRATSGPMAFFTDDPAIASSYAEGKQDTSLDAPEDYAGWFKYRPAGARSDVDIDRAWYALSPEERATIAEKLPHVTNFDENNDEAESLRLGNEEEYGLAGKSHWDYEIKQARGNVLKAAKEIWLNSGILFGDESSFMDVLKIGGMPMKGLRFDSPNASNSGVFPVYLNITKPFDTKNAESMFPAFEAAAKNKRGSQLQGVDTWDKRSMSGKDWVGMLKSDVENNTTHAWTSIPDWVTDTLKDRGFDGIKDVGGKNGGHGHTVWIPFTDTQVKSAIGNSGKFDMSKPSILASKRTYTPEQEEFLRKGGQAAPKGRLAALGESVRDRVDAIKSYEKDDFLQTQFDRFHAFMAREAVAGPIPDEQSSYIAARMATSAGQSADWAIENSGLKWDGSVLVPDENVPSLFKVLEAAGGDARGFLGWKTAVRAERLLSEGKENNFTADDIKAGLKLNEGREAEFDDAFNKYAEFSKNLVDIGEYGGIIDPTTRALWENPDYIPFLRDNPDAGSAGVTSGPANQRSPIKKLHGGKEVLKDPLESIISGTYQMIDAAMNNRAALLAVDNLGHMGGIEDVTAQYKQAIIPMPQLKKILEDRGMSKQQIAQMPKEVFEGMQKVMSIVPPTGPDVIRVLRDGKPEYYRVTDPLLMRAFTGFESRESNMAMNVARATKRVLTWGVTKMPDFIVRNNARDTATSYLVHPDQMLPGLRAAKGALGTLMNDKLNQTMMASGGGFGEGRFDVRDPGASNRQMRALLKRRGMKPFEIKHFMSSLLNTPGKLWNAYSSLNKASENANRYARAKYHLDKGDSMTRAMFEAKDMLDFSMQGDGKLMLFLADTVPFFNARIQGQYKLARAGAIPGLGMKRRVAAKAFMMAMASTAYIWSIMNDPEKKKLYDALPEWDRLGSYHFWGAKGEDGQRAHWRIPRPFEAGFLFGTIPEEFYLSLSKNAEWKEGIQHIGQGISSQLGFNPIGQAVRPLYDAARNEDTFSHRQIESLGDAGRDPADRYDDRTSPIAKAIAKPFSEGLTAAIRTVNPDSEATGISPKKLEYLFDQYTGGFGQWALDRADKMVRTAMSDKESTVGEKLSAVLGNAPVPGEPSPNGAHPLLSIGKIYKSDNGTEYSRYDEEFSNLSKLADAAQRRINQLREEGSDEEAASKQDEKNGLLQFRPQIAKDKKRIKGLYKQADDIRADDKLTSDEKRDKINVLLRERERIVKASYLRYKVSSGTARINEDSSLSPSEKATAIKNLEDHYKSLED